MRLDEIMRSNPRPLAVHLEPWMYKTKKEIIHWLKTNQSNMEVFNSIDDWIIADDLEVMVHGSLVLKGDISRSTMPKDIHARYDQLKGREKINQIYKNHPIEVAPETLVKYGSDIVLPVMFKFAKSVDIRLPLTSLIGCPSHVLQEADFNLLFLSDFHGCPVVVGHELHIKNFGHIKDFSTMPQNIHLPAHHWRFK